MELVACTHDSHARAILEIVNDVISTSTAVFDYQPRPFESMAAWFEVKKSGDYPVIGAVDGDGRLMGFATYGRFRPWPGYKYTVEHSVYVHRDHRGMGVGLALLRRLIDAAQEQQYHLLVAGIDGENSASIALHRKLGFSHAGTIRQAGFKFGRWLDLVFYQLLLATPVAPRDG